MSAQKTITSLEKKQHILVCLSASPSNEKIVQTAAKMAKAMIPPILIFRSGLVLLHYLTFLCD